MTLNITNIKHAGITTLALGIVLGLGACSSKPSPWSQQSSPWENREEETAQPEEQSPFVDDSEQVESVYVEPAEPAGEATIDEPASAESEFVAEPEPVMEPEPVVEAEPEPVEEEPAMTATGGSISSQPAGHYAVQVCASSSMENLMAFAKNNQLSDEWTAETSVDGKIWFVLLQGIYPTMDEAKAAMVHVETLETSPWVRSVGSLQAVIAQ
jgi:septal ring-binding cell division protein DamX